MSAGAETSQSPTNSLELTATWLAAAGVRTVGDIPVNRSCDAPALLIDEGTVPRSDFSEVKYTEFIESIIRVSKY